MTTKYVNTVQGSRKLLKSGEAKSTGRLMGCYFILRIKLFMYMLVPTLLQKYNSIL